MQRRWWWGGPTAKEAVWMRAELLHLLEVGSGLVTREQLRAAGVDRRGIWRAIKRGELICVHPKVLALPGSTFDVWGRYRAALLQVGPDAALTHVSALHAWGLYEESPITHVSVPRAGVVGYSSVRVHCRGAQEIHTVAGFPVQTPADALALAAADLDLDELRFPAMEANRRGLLTPRNLEDASRWDRVRTPMLLLAEEAAAGAESGGEAKFWRLIKESPLPTPVLQQEVMTAHGLKRLDGYWPDLGLGVEIDGREFHNTADAFVSDRVKQNAVHGLGLVLMRYAVSQVMNEEEYVLTETETIIVARRAVLCGYVSHFPK